MHMTAFFMLSQGQRGMRWLCLFFSGKIPEQWADEIVSMDSAKEALQMAREQVQGGHNHDLIDEWAA
jgi:hypothetical protein